jgi:phenylacetate-CoA ligase
MKVFSLQEIYSTAKSKSEFFKALYKNVPEVIQDIEQLPLTDLKAYWNMNSLTNNHLLTAPIEDAIVFKSGGTTGNPKFSVYTREEWRTFTHFFGLGMGHSVIAKKDRVANLFYAGDLYASFLFIHDSLERSSQSSVNFPISGNIDPCHLAQIVKDFSINVLAGVPTTVISLAKYFYENKLELPSINKILFGGESLYADQRAFLQEVFPGVKMQSIGIASVDGGLIGYTDQTCGTDEHRSFGQATIVEIIDDLGKVISEPGTAGQVYLTALTRNLMPIIRYPGGDRAQWTENEGTMDRKFKILGRAEEGARIGPISVYYDDIHSMLLNLDTKIGFHGFQLVTTRENSNDVLTIRLGKKNQQPHCPLETSIIINELFKQRPMIKELIEEEKIGTPKVEWVDQLEINSRTGKLRRVLDLRKEIV